MKSFRVFSAPRDDDVGAPQTNENTRKLSVRYLTTAPLKTQAIEQFVLFQPAATYV